jgi:hypothetical protein
MTLNLGKILGGLIFIANTGVQAAQTYSEPGFSLPAPWRFGLFVAGASLGAALLLLPRPGESTPLLPRG